VASVEREVKFHDVLRQLLERSSATVTRKKLAAAIGVSDATVSHYVTGRIKPSFEALVGISRFFNVPLDDLVFGERISEAPITESDSVRAEVLRALAVSNDFAGRQRDLTMRISRRLYDQVEQTARSLVESSEHLGPAGLLSNSEAIAFESCAVRTRTMIRTLPADFVEGPSGAFVPGTYFQTLIANLTDRRRYDFLFYGRRAKFEAYVHQYRDYLPREGLPAEIVHGNLAFRSIDLELPATVVLMELDTAAVERREPILWERYREGGIRNGTLAYVDMRYEDALGGVVLRSEYFDSAIRMFDRDWKAATPL
jgi:transcriptional regulator with XRE-family HTH domain